MYGNDKRAFRYAKLIARHNAPKWVLKKQGITFVANWLEYLKQQNSRMPVYSLSNEEKNVRVDQLQASLIDTAGRESPVWRQLELTDRGYRSFHWKKLGLFKAKEKRYSGVAYRFGLNVPKAVNDGDIVLHLPRSAFVTELMVNGVKKAESREGLLPINFNLTPFLKAGAENQITLKVYDYRKGFNAGGKQILPMGAMFKYFSGLVRPLQLRWQPKLKKGG